MHVKRLALHGLVAVFTSFTTSDAIILEESEKEHVASNASVGLGQDDHLLARLTGGHKAPLTTAALVSAAAGGRPATADSLTFQATTLAPWHWSSYLPYVLLILSLTWMHVYVYLRDRPSLVVAGVYVLYIGLHTTASSMQVLVGKSPTNTNTIGTAQAVVFMSLVLKLAISAVQVLVEMWNEKLPAGHLLENLKESVLCSVVPSAFYTTSDVFLVYCQQSMAMTEVQILQKIGIPITAFVWWRMFRVTIGHRKILSLVIIMSGTILYAYGQSSPSADVSGKSDSGATLSTAGVWFHRSMLLLQVLCGTCGGVSNEYFLLRCSASVSMQNCAMYSQGLLIVMVSTLCFGTGTPAHHALQFSGMQWGCVLALALTGICTSHFLRHLGSIWKQVAFGAMLVIFFTVDNVLFGKTYANLAVGGVVIVLCGNCLAVLDGVQDSRPLVPSKPGASNSTDDLKDNAATVEAGNKKPLAPPDDSPPLAAA